MAKRGRKSSASLSVISGNGIEVIARPDAPVDLTDEQAAEWRAIVTVWFNCETCPQLTQYCRHIVTAYRMAQLIEQEETSDDPLDLDRYDQLLRMKITGP